MKSDLAIAREAVMAPIAEIAAAAGFLENELEPYGKYKAKLAEVGADVIQTAAVENIEKKDIDTISHRLSKLFELKENGVITEEEFAEQKKIILGE